MNAESPSNRGEILTEISNGIVGLLKEYYGKGPTRARTYYEDDLVVCLMRGGFTPAEQTLIEAGRVSSVVIQRLEFNEIMRERFAAVVEHATSRSVLGFMSANQHDPEMIGELFVLGVRNGDEPPPDAGATS